jgi:hypothetical protein
LFSVSLIDSHNADRKTLLDRMRRWKDPDLRKAVAAQLSDPSTEAISISKSRPLNQYELAKRADMEDWYLSLYTLLSFSAHSAISDLASHLVNDEEGELEALQNEPQLGGQPETWAYIIEVQLRSMAALAKLFSVEPPHLEALKAHLKLLAVENAV